ncbi:MAG: hypothetical protein KDA96_00900 [Planctomycetaceae bacterium]|nr:hypothetical protein [Planctomycetaceae bacterium]
MNGTGEHSTGSLRTSPSYAPRWLKPFAAAIVGSAVAFLVAWRTPPEQEAMAAQMKEFEALGEAQERVIRADEYIQTLSPSHREELQKLHQYLQDKPETQRKLDQYYHWWESLAWSDYQDFERIADPVERIDEKRQRFERDVQEQTTLAFDFRLSSLFPYRMTGGFNNSSSAAEEEMLPHLDLSLPSFANILNAARPDETLSPDRTSTLASFNHANDRVLQKTIWLLQDISEAADPFPIIDQVAANILQWGDNASWNESFQSWIDESRRLEKGATAGGGFERARRGLVISLLLKEAATQLRDDLKKRMDTDQQKIIETFAAISDPQERRRVMTLEPAAARARLETLSSETREGQLLQQLSDLESQRHTYVLQLLQKARK